MMRNKSIGHHRRPHLRKLLLREKTTKLGIALVSHCSCHHHHHHIDDEKGQVTVPKGGSHFQSKNLHCRFWTFLGFFQTFSKKLQHNFPKSMGGEVKDRLELFRKFIRFGTVNRP